MVFCVRTFLCLSFVLTANARNVHQKDQTGGLRRSAHLHSLQKQDLQSAVAAVLGDGHNIHHGHLEEIQRRISPLWKSLPTNEFGRIDRRSLRYAVHRYFMQVYSMSVIGLEPAQVNGQHDDALLLSKVVPAYVKTELEGKSAQVGFSLEDAVVMVATLERLMSDSGHELLEKSYEAVNQKTGESVGRASAKRILEAYMLRWMLGDDTEGIEELESNQTLLEESLEDWPTISGFVHGELQTLEFARRAPLKAMLHDSWNEFRPRFSFTDVETVVNSVTMSFGNFWTTECQRVKQLLVDMDHSKTGRVSLADFYGAAMNGEWRFSESKDYLRAMGALDETSAWRGPKVIITNYMQAASNCIVSSPHYRVCCANECDTILADLEAKVEAPLAASEDILQIVAAHESSSDVVRLSASLKKQLEDIARTGPGGLVPLHGRLFAQWLHYVFPQECPFPHKSGATVALSPLEFGDDYAASEQEMSSIAAVSQDTPSGETEDEWLSQWSQEEELLSESTHLHAPWEVKLSGSSVCILLVMIAAFAAHKVTSGLGRLDVLPTSSKTHCC